MRIPLIRKLFLFLICCFVVYLTSTSNLPNIFQWVPKSAIGILAIVVAAIQLYSVIPDIFSRKRILYSEKISETPFPFEIVDSLDKLYSLLFPSLGSTPIPDTDIPFIDHGLTRLSVEFNRKNRVILIGQSKLGKTRLMTKILKDELVNGAGILILKHYQWFYPSFIPPESLRGYKNFVIAVDDLNHYLDFKAPADAGYRAFPFDEFLVDAIHNIENTCGNDIKIKIIITAKPEQSFWKSYKLENVLWQSFQLIEIAPMSNQETRELIHKLANRTGIEVGSQYEKELTARNDGTFMPLILAFRKWKSMGIQSLGSNETASFEGQLRKAWSTRFNNLIRQNEFVKNVYGVIDFLQRQGIAPSIFVVEELATLLSINNFSLFIAHWNELYSFRFVYPLMNKTEKYWRRFNYFNIGVLYLIGLACLLLMLKIGGNKLLVVSFGVLILVFFLLSILSSVVIVIQAIFTNLEAKIKLNIQRSIQHFIKLEIPINNDIFYPYDGQVDGISDDIQFSKLADIIQGLHKGYWASAVLSLRLLEVAKFLQWTNSVESLRILQLCKEINPNLFDAYFLEAQIYQSQNSLSLARNSYTQLIINGPPTLTPDSYSELGLVELQLGNLRESKRHAQLAMSLIKNGISTERTKVLSYLCSLKSNKDKLKTITRWVISTPTEKEIFSFIKIIESVDIDVQRVYKLQDVRDILMNALRNRRKQFQSLFLTLYQSYAKQINNILFYPIPALFSVAIAILFSYPIFFSYSPAIAKNLLNISIFVVDDVPWLYTQRAFAYALLQNPTNCLNDSINAVQLDSTNPFPYFVKGVCYFDTDPEKAIENFSAALSLDSKSQSVGSLLISTFSYSADYTYFLRGVSYEKTGNLPQAISDWSSAIALYNWNPQYYLQRGRAYFELNQFQLAIQDFTHVIEMPVTITPGFNPQKGDAHYARGYVYFSQGETEKALMDLNIALKSDTGSGDISSYSLIRSYLLKGLIELDKKEASSALQDCTKAKDLAFIFKDDTAEAAIDGCINDANVLLNTYP